MEHTGGRRGNILALAPASSGVGFAVLNEKQKLLDWGVKTIWGEKNVSSLAKIRQLIERYEPSVLVFEDSVVPAAGRARRIQMLNKQIHVFATKRGILTTCLTKETVSERIAGNKEGTKMDLVRAVAHVFPAELGFRVPAKCSIWRGEDYRVRIFYAVALGLAFKINGPH